MALACLVAGDRHHHLATEIRPPSCQAGAIVISDRYLPSSLVLQRMDGVDQDDDLAAQQRRRTPRTWPSSSTPRQRSSPPGSAQRGGTHSRFERQPGSVRATESRLLPGHGRRASPTSAGRSAVVDVTNADHPMRPPLIVTDRVLTLHAEPRSSSW